MKRATLLLCAVLSGGCAQQDAALLVTMSAPDILVPSGGDTLTLDVYDGTTSIKHLSWCAQPSATCPALPAQNPLSASVTLVQSGAAHPHLKLNATLFLSNHLVEAGTLAADFSSGRTEPVTIAMTRP